MPPKGTTGVKPRAGRKLREDQQTASAMVANHSAKEAESTITTTLDLESFQKATKEQIVEEYRRSYEIDDLTSPNDKANLDTMIMNALAIRALQSQLLKLTIESVTDNAPDIKRINDSIRDLTNLNLSIERQLGIDRKARKADNEQSVVEYIAWLKTTANEFLNERLLKIYCKKCMIMVGRVSGVYDTTSYSCDFQCPQCKKLTHVERKDRDVFFDVRDAGWRRKYPMEIVQRKVIAMDTGEADPSLDPTADPLAYDFDEVEDDIVIRDDTITDIIKE